MQRAWQTTVASCIFHENALFFSILCFTFHGYNLLTPSVTKSYNFLEIHFAIQ